MLYYAGWIWIVLFILVGRMMAMENGLYFSFTVLQVLVLGVSHIYWKGLNTKEFVLTGIILVALYFEIMWVHDNVVMAF